MYEFLTLLTFFTCFTLSYTLKDGEKIQEFFDNTSSHTNNWAVIVGASRFWFNYRHVANALSIYRSVKKMGIPDSQIILMISDDMACDPRNPWPGTVFNNVQHHINVYGNNVEVDYRGYEVTVENFIRLLTGRVLEASPKSKRLNTNSGSNILIYMTGHGGDGFLKFQDSEELTSIELANAFEQMYQKQRYNEILFVIDTCQAESMSSLIYSPNIVGIGSSKIGEDSLSHHGDPSVGVYVIDRYTYYVLEFLEKNNKNTKVTLKDFFDVCPKKLCISTVSVRTEMYRRDPSKVLLSEFFGNIAELNFVKLSQNTSSTFNIPALKQNEKKTDDNLPIIEPYSSSWHLVDPFPADFLSLQANN